MGGGGGGIGGLFKSVYKPFTGIFGYSDSFKTPKPPPLPPPPKFDAKAAAKAAQQAALKKKKAAQAAFGYEDAALTGPSGLAGGVPSIYQGTKTATGT